MRIPAEVGQLGGEEDERFATEMLANAGINVELIGDSDPTIVRFDFSQIICEEEAEEQLEAPTLPVTTLPEPRPTREHRPESSRPSNTQLPINQLIGQPQTRTGNPLNRQQETNTSKQEPHVQHGEQHQHHRQPRHCRRPQSQDARV